MATSMGEIDAMLRRLPALQADQSLRAAEVAFVAAASDDERRPWWDRLARIVRGDKSVLPRGQHESAASIRARKMAERQAAGR